MTDKQINTQKISIERMVTRSYRIKEVHHADAELASRQLHGKSLSKVIRDFVEKLAKKKRQ
jgi:hypothetical protein